jgi:tetratricopeptide (TPR) repeat protein
MPPLPLPLVSDCPVPCHVMVHPEYAYSSALLWADLREAAEGAARRAAQTGDEHDELVAEGARYGSKRDWRRAARAFREAIELSPDEPTAYFNLGAALNNSAHDVEAAQRYLEAKERFPVGSAGWAMATASAFDLLRLEACAEVAKPEWWSDEGLKALSASVVRAAPDDLAAHKMRGYSAERDVSRLGDCASLGGGAQGGGRALGAGCGAVPCSGGESRPRQ